MEKDVNSPLTRLAHHYGTDKLEHGYIPYYEKLLPHDCESLLEIGCFKGASLQMWDKYYDGLCDIHTIDLFGEKWHMRIPQVRALNCVPHQGSQADLEFLSTIKKQFEVIIDDGSHVSEHMTISFKHLFHNNLKAGGLYVIEDLHCCKEEFYRPGLSFEDTPLYMLSQFEKTGKIPLDNQFFNVGEKAMFENLIEWVKVFDEKIAFIKRK